MMYKMLHEMKEGNDRSFVDKFREYMSNSERPSRHKHDDPSWAFMPSKDKSHWDFYMRRDGMPHYDSRTNFNEVIHYEHQQVHRVYRQAVRQPRPDRQLLLPGPDPGGYPRGKPLHGPVH